MHYQHYFIMIRNMVTQLKLILNQEKRNKDEIDIKKLWKMLAF